MAELLRAQSQNDFRGCSEGWNTCTQWYVDSNGNYFQAIIFKYNNFTTKALSLNEPRYIIAMPCKSGH